MTEKSVTSRLFFVLDNHHLPRILLAFITLINISTSAKAKNDVHDDRSPDCRPSQQEDNHTITNTSTTQPPCVHLVADPLDKGASIAVSVIAVAWILLGICMVYCQVIHDPQSDRQRRQHRRRRRRRHRGECSESGDTEADSTWDDDMETSGWSIPQRNDGEIPTTNTAPQIGAPY